MILNETLTTIKKRRSTRNFKIEQIKNEELEAILEAGKYAPNAGGEAWHFTVIQNSEILNKLNKLAKEAAIELNIQGLKELGENGEFNCLYNAPTLIIISASTELGIPLDADCAAANENLLIAAESLGIGSCWVFFVTLAFMGSKGNELLEELKIPRGYKPYYASIFGYKAEEDEPIPSRSENLVTYIK